MKNRENNRENNREKTFTIGVMKRFNSFCPPWDLEIYDSNLKQYDTEKQYIRAIRKLKWKRFIKERNRILYWIKTWRTSTRKDWGNYDYIDYFIN